MIPIDPVDPTPSRRTALPGSVVRRGRFVPLLAAGVGVVLVVVSAVLLVHHRGLPDSFGTVPGADGSSIGSPVAASASPVPAVPSSAAQRPSTAAARSTTSAPTATPTSTHATAGTQATAGSRSIGTGSTRNTPTARRSSAAHQTTPRSTAATDPRELPRQLLLPRFGIHADVLPVTSTDGVLAVPENPQQVGWWAGSALPGSTSGTTVIDGHIDSATAGVGALIHLSDLVPGDSVSIVGSTGKTIDYRVVARRVYVKHAGLPSSLFAPGGPQRLLLISCGGPFDSDRGSYEDNIVVFATPVAR